MGANNAIPKQEKNTSIYNYCLDGTLILMSCYYLSGILKLEQRGGHLLMFFIFMLYTGLEVANETLHRPLSYEDPGTRGYDTTIFWWFITGALFF